MALSIGQGLASIGSSIKESRQLGLQKEALKMKKQEFELSQQIRQAQLEDVMIQREEKDRLNKIRGEVQKVRGKISPKFPDTTTTSLEPLSATSVLADFPEDRPTATDFLGQVDFDALPTQGTRQAETQFEDVESDTLLGQIPDDVISEFNRPKTSGKAGRKQAIKGDKGVLGDFVSSKLDELSPVKRGKGKGNRLGKETKASIADRKSMRANIMSAIERGEQPETTRLPTEPLGVLQLPEEQAPQAPATFFTASGQQEEGELQGPQNQLETVTEGAFKTDDQLMAETMDELQKIDGFGELDPAERKQIIEEHMLGLKTEQDQLEINNIKSQIHKRTIDSSIALAGLNPTVDKARLVGKVENFPEFSNVEFQAGSNQKIGDFTKRASEVGNAINILDRSMELGTLLNQGGGFTGDLSFAEQATMHAELQSMKNQLIGMLRIPITGPGILTEADKKMISETVGAMDGILNFSFSPSDANIFFERNKAKVVSARGRFRQQLINESKIFMPKKLANQEPEQRVFSIIQEG